MSKERDKSTQFILSVVFSLVAVAINYGISFVLTSYITEHMGTEAYGFVSLAKIVANYGSIATVALNSFAARYITVEYHKGNFDKANQYYSSVFIADVVIGFVLFTLFAIVILFLDNIISIPTELISDVRRLFFLDVVNFLIASTGTVFMVATTITNRLELAGIIKSASYLLEAVFLWVAYTLFPAELAFVGLGLIISTVSMMVCNYVITNKMTPELKIKRVSYSKPAVFELLKAGIWNSVNSLGNLLQSGLDLLISNIMLSPFQSGQLAIVKTVSTIFSTLFQLIAQPFQPLQLKYYALGDKTRLIDSFMIAMKIDGLFSNLLFAGFAVFGRAFFKLWVPTEDSTILYGITLVTIVGTLTEGATYPLFYAYTLTVKNKIPCYVTLLTGFMNVAGMYILIKYFNAGLYAVVGTTAVISILGNYIFTPLYTSHCMNISKWAFYPPIIRHTISAAVITGVFFLVSRIITPASWLGLIGIGIAGSIVGSIIHCLIVFNHKDWQLATNKLLRRKA